MGLCASSYRAKGEFHVYPIMSHPILVTGAAGGTQGSTGQLANAAKNPQTHEEFFRENAGFLAASTQEA